MGLLISEQLSAMAKYRSLLASVLAIAAVFLIGLSSPAWAKGKAKTPTYTPEQIAEIQTYASDVSAMRDRMTELQALIQKEDWTFVRNFIHGPLGELRVKMSAVVRDLLPDAQKPARTVVKEVFDNLVAIDRAAENADYKLAVRNYGEAIRNFDEFFQLIPKG
jgi:photosystem II protein PsbQ